MAEDGRTTLGTLRRGDVFRTADGQLWRRTSSHLTATEVQGNVALCDHVGRENAAMFLPHDAEVEPLDIPALLKELDELRTLAHDLLLDRDAAYGREVGRGEALAAAEKWWEDVQDVDLEVGRLFDAIRGPTPVRPLPPPERLAARCRALEDALRDLVAGHLNEMTARGLPHEWAPDSPMGRAVRLLEENSADE